MNRDDAKAAYDICAVASLEDVKVMSARCDRNGVAGSLLTATVRQCEGDVLAAEAALSRAADVVSTHDRAYVVDALATLLISRGLFIRAAALLETAASPNLELCRRALRTVIDAGRGAIARSADSARSLTAELPRVDDDVMRLRIRQRLALGAAFRRDTGEALEHVAHGLGSARLIGAHRLAAALHWVACGAHRACTGDVEAAWRHAKALVREAELGGDASHRLWGRITLYELAAERGDDAEFAAARAALDAEAGPRHARDRFPARIADGLCLGWRCDFASARAALIELEGTTARTDGERALCRALIGVASLALHDDHAARRYTRQAMSPPVRSGRRQTAHELRYHRLARALASGNALQGHGIGGYARFLSLARREFERRPVAGPLTAAEVDILELLDTGRNAPQIAALLERSPHTVRTHLRNVSTKLQTHGRAATLTRARQLGLLRARV